MKRLLFVAFMLFVLWKLTGGSDKVVLGPGVKVVAAPSQEEIKKPDSFQFKDYRITPLADFRLKAKILARENYSLGRESELSPVDLALGWGQMSDETVLEDIEISQSGRWYRWYVQSFPIPRRAIETQSANMHMIPANDLVDDMIDLAKQGQIIELEGYLIRADSNDGWHWQSSLTRDDVGGRACEVIFVTDFQIIE